jgi:hypothetical protein
MVTPFQGVRSPLNRIFDVVLTIQIPMGQIFHGKVWYWKPSGVAAGNSSVS